MTLPTGTITAGQINTELGRATTTSINLNETIVRNLAGKPTGQSLIGYSDLQGKSAGLMHQFLVVAAGGAGGWCSDTNYTLGGGGGGAGAQMQYGAIISTGSVFNLTVGSGGARVGALGFNSSGGNSYIRQSAGASPATDPNGGSSFNLAVNTCYGGNGGGGRSGVFGRADGGKGAVGQNATTSTVFKSGGVGYEGSWGAGQTHGSSGGGGGAGLVNNSQTPVNGGSSGGSVAYTQRPGGAGGYGTTFVLYPYETAWPMTNLSGGGAGANRYIDAATATSVGWTGYYGPHGDSPNGNYGGGWSYYTTAWQFVAPNKPGAGATGWSNTSSSATHNGADGMIQVWYKSGGAIRGSGGLITTYADWVSHTFTPALAPTYGSTYTYTG